VVDGFLGDRLAGELLEQVVAMGGTSCRFDIKMAARL
jgi:hypothetical protein